MIFIKFMFSPIGLYDPHHSSLPSTSSLKSGIFGVWKKKKGKLQMVHNLQTPYSLQFFSSHFWRRKSPFFVKKLLYFPHFISLGEHVNIGLCTTGYTFYGVVQNLSSINSKSALGGSPWLLKYKIGKINTHTHTFLMCIWDTIFPYF